MLGLFELLQHVAARASVAIVCFVVAVDALLISSSVLLWSVLNAVLLYWAAALVVFSFQCSHSQLQFMPSILIIPLMFP